MDRPQPENRRLALLSTASLIVKYLDRYPADALAAEAVQCYDMLLAVIETPAVTWEISRMIDQTEDRTKSAAIAIVQLLLSTGASNPVLSLGLPESATEEEIKKRWKHLIMIFHPDKSKNPLRNEELAKQINQSYSEALKSRKSKTPPSMTFAQPAWPPVQKPVTSNKEPPRRSLQFTSHSKFLRRLPMIILVTAIAIALFTVSIFIFQKIGLPQGNSYPYRINTQ